ncbi:MAG: hypothetical protein ACREBT_05370 [Thermoplasmata archaeon]
MSRATPKEIRAEDFHPAERVALAYVAPEGDLALYNDYEGHESWLVRAPQLDPDAKRVVGNWRRPVPGSREITLGEAVQGYGVFTFPYGPVAMGIPEAGAFDLRTYGERILEVTPSVGFKQRGIDRLVIGRSVEDAALIVERRSGPFALAHVAAFLAAAESATSRRVPERELWVRALAQEIQRTTDHLRVIARIADAASQNVGAAQVHALEEESLRLTARYFGHRFGFGALVPGGPRRRLDAPDRAELGERAAAIGHAFDALWETLLVSRTFIDRIQSTGTIPTREAIRWAAVGPTLRASNVAWDDRLRQPSRPYSELFVPLAIEVHGDALARALVRREEIRASLLMVEQLLDQWDRPGASEADPLPPIDPGRGLARVEAPSGDLVYDVRIENGVVRAMGVRTPSEANWSVIALSLRGAVFTDFSFDLESFGLSFAETDG